MEKEKVIAQLMNTVGYNESDHRTEYLKGAGMAFDKCDVEFALLKSNTSTTIFQLEKELEQIKRVISQFGNLVKNVRKENEI